MEGEVIRGHMDDPGCPLHSDPSTHAAWWHANAEALLDAVIAHDDEMGHLANSTGDELRDALRLAADRLRAVLSGDSCEHGLDCTGTGPDCAKAGTLQEAYQRGWDEAVALASDARNASSDAETGQPTPPRCPTCGADEPGWLAKVDPCTDPWHAGQPEPNSQSATSPPRVGSSSAGQPTPEYERVGWWCSTTDRLGRYLDDDHKNCIGQHEPVFRKVKPS